VVLLVRFGELTLKSIFVRKQLQERLLQNIHEHFAARGIECATSMDRARIYVEANDLTAAIRALEHVFGITSFSDAVQCSSDLEEMCNLAADYSAPHLRSGMSFAVRARRSGTHSYTSQDLGREAGSAIWSRVQGLRVDLSDPDYEMHIEVRENRAYLFHQIVPGPGGLPLSSQGRVLALVERLRDLAAAWFMMKRGCRVVVALAGESSLAEPLRSWDTGLKIQEAGDLKGLAEVARASRCEGLAVGWSVTELRRRALELPPELPLFHPLVGLSDEEIDEILRRIRS